MKRIKQMADRMLKNGTLPLLLLGLILIAQAALVLDAYDTPLADAKVEPADEPGWAKINLYGGNLFSVNAFYLDGKLADANVPRVVYDRTYATIPIDGMVAGDWYKLEVGFSKWGIINIKSNPIWIEWPDGLEE